MLRFLTMMLLSWSMVGLPIGSPAAPFDASQSYAAPENFQSTGILFQPSVASTFGLAPNLSTRLRDLAPETEGPRVKGLLAKMSWLKGTFVTETEVANSYGGASWLDARIAGDQRIDPATQMVRLGVTADMGRVNYGFTYRQAGQAFLNGPDQGGREIWGQWKAQGMTLRSAVGQLWNNVAEDSTRSRLMQTYGRMTLGLTRPAWPEVSFTYARIRFRPCSSRSASRLSGPKATRLKVRWRTRA